MAAPRRRKCLHCQRLFAPDCRNRRHQHYCGQSACRQASKTASQRRWLAKPENRNYFRGPDQVQRVQAWRAAHPGYARRQRSEKSPPLQEVLIGQTVEADEESASLALQELFSAAPLVLLGLLAHLTGSTLQEDIEANSRRLIRLANDILGGRPNDDTQSGDMSRAAATLTPAVQLDRSTPGP